MERPRPTVLFSSYRIPGDLDVLYRDDAVVPLERRAVRVLRHLAEHHDRVVSKEEIIDRVWEDLYTGDDVLKRAILLVRRALDDDTERPRFVETHRGLGYRFIAPVTLAPAHDDASGGVPRERAPRPGNLPAQVTSFVGRERELNDVRRALASTRLLTLVGPGGVGKTRLALELASAALEHYADGVWVIELASLTDPGLLPTTLLGTLGVPEEPGRSLAATLADALRSKQMLLVLDNCEHLVDACATQAAALLRSSPHLRLLAVSRESLGVPGETVWPVTPLTLPDLDSPPGELERYDAVRLFAERAGSYRPDFALTPENAGAVADLCRRLEGVPLALELAAARVKAFSVAQIVARVGDSLELLTGGGRATVARQRTLRGSIDWSYDMLSDPERALLRRLSVFAGGWTLDAAESVCSEDEGGRATERRPAEIFDLLARLVDKSLISVEEGRAGVRYRMLEAIRQYAGERLRGAEDAEATMDRHRNWCVRLAEDAEEGLAGPEQIAWLRRVDAEHDNLRAAMQYDLGSPGAAEGAMRMAAALLQFWHTHGHVSEGLRWLEPAAVRGASAPLEVRAKALLAAGLLTCDQGDYPRGLALYEESLALRRQSTDRHAIAATLRRLGVAAVVVGDHERARRAIEESLVTSRELGDRRGIASAVMYLGMLAHGRDDYERASAHYEESLAMHRDLDDRRQIGILLVNLGDTALKRDELDRAAAFLEESLEVSRDLGFKQNVGHALGSLGEVARMRGDYERAVVCFREALETFQGLGDRRGVAYALESFAQTAAARGLSAMAMRLAGAAAALRDASTIALGAPESAALERGLEPARIALGPAEAERARTEGRAMPIARAVAHALAFEPTP
jgi:predicted ATPase/DNA-binding winged helix-turn-helix (wHTH) protein